MPEITNRHFKHLIYWKQNILLLLTSHYSHFEKGKISLYGQTGETTEEALAAPAS